MMSDASALAPELFSPDPRITPWGVGRSHTSPKSTKFQKATQIWTTSGPETVSCPPTDFGSVISERVDFEEAYRKALPLVEKDLIQALAEPSRAHLESLLEKKLREDLLLNSDVSHIIQERVQDADVSLMREAGLPGLAVIFCSIPLIALSPAVGIAGMFVGSAVFWLANYASYRAGQEDWIVGPAGAAKLFAGSMLLAITAVVAAFTN